ncbi:PARP-domain-containing protein [Heliocybe sulcata]|uniref:Poly [ADP-ribose] polymerase n=1 Tax=Heliocybe sulcata TaxID=5364 RepID=A0A5C3NIA7_9AGAM|nr:PARP-domain-containing protein [Heliocybe sulcata]
MPPRKKTIDATQPAAPTRRSTRTKTAATTTQSQSQPEATSDVDQTSTTKKKATSKRARHKTVADDEDAPVAKKAKADADPDKEASQEPEVKKDEEEKEKKAEEKEKKVTVLKRGAAPVDPHSGLVYTHQVYSNSEGVWDAMLNQTNISGSKNSNKFYVIQVLHPIGDPSTCQLFTRWGRIGENGQTQTKGHFDPASTVRDFRVQFRKKTGVNWEQRHGMTATKGKYVWIERSFEEDKEDKEEGSSGDSKKEEEKPVESRLSPELQSFCQIIFSSKLVDATLTSMNYDANKLPLGKLSKSTVLNGFAALKELSEVIDNPNCATATQFGGQRQACEELSGRYYSIIPHAFGRNRPITIDNMATLKKELELVDALGDMEVAQTLIKSTVMTDEDGNALNPLDAHFKTLKLTRMDPLDRDSTEFKALETYAHNTHGSTHHFRVQVLNIFQVDRQSETDAWMKAGFDKLKPGQRRLLWHGSRPTNFAGILSQGLRIAPPEAPVNGYMFGKGVYFADMMSKSAGYCYAHMSNGVGILLLCDVAVKPFFEQTGANYNADQDCKKNNALSTLGQGTVAPDKWQDAGKALGNPELDGCDMPAGSGEAVKVDGAYLQYNEYIVYDAAQIRVRYLLMVKLH